MTKRFLIGLLLLLLLPAAAGASLDIATAVQENGENRIVSMIMANPVGDMAQMSEEESAAQMQAIVNANMNIQTRFPLAQYQIAMTRVGGEENAISQTLRLYQDGKTASVAVLWQGEQANGTRGSSVQSLALDLTTGEEIAFDALFDDPEAAAAAMEAIIEAEVMAGLSDYMAADLLPMPRDCFSYDETGLTVYYPQERYTYFSGRSGAVHFAWHEIDAFISEGSPVYALASGDALGAQDLSQAVSGGKLPGAMAFGLGDLLGDALDMYTPAADADYTTESMVYQFEEEHLRGFALEIPKYAETAEEKTPISAVRASRVSLCGIETGVTTKALAAAQLGEAQMSRVYDRDDAADRMLCAGESLFYSVGEYVLQLHFDEEEVLDMMMLRTQTPQDNL